MQYCSLQHWTLLPSPITYTTGCCFCLGSVSSFSLELFLHWYPVAYWAPSDLGSWSFSVLSFCLFKAFSRQEYWSGFQFPSPVEHILSELSIITCLSWVALHVQGQRSCSKTVGARAAAAWCWSDFEEIPHVHGHRWSPKRMVGGGEIAFRIKPHTPRETQKAQTYLVHTRTQRPHRHWDRTVFGCLLRRYVSAADCFRGRSSGCSRPGYGMSSLEVLPLTHHSATRSYTGLGNRLWESTKRTLCAPGPRKKEQWPHRSLTQTCPWGSRRLQWRCGAVVACCRAGGTECTRACMRPFEGGLHYLHYL